MESNKRNLISSDSNVEDKKHNQTDSNVDSGFLSGPVERDQFDSSGIVHHSSDDAKPTAESQSSKRHDDLKAPSCQENIDSGLVSDCSTEVTSKDSKMQLQNPIDSNTNEWSSKLGHSDGPMNDLSKKSTPSTLVSTCKTEEARTQPECWEIYYKQNDEGDTYLHIAVIHGQEEVVIVLLERTPHPLLLDIQNDYAQTALHIAVATSQPNIVRKLIIAGAKASIRDRYGNNPLHIACSNGDVKCVERILVAPKASEFPSKKAHSQFFTSIDLEQWNYDGEKCVHLAAQNNQVAILKLLVESGADINAREGKSGRTPLHYAVENKNLELAKYLLFDCPKINLESTTYAGVTAFQLARLMQNQYMLSQLQERGAQCISPAESETDDSDSDVEEEMFTRSNPVGRFTESNSISLAY